MMGYPHNASAMAGIDPGQTQHAAGGTARYAQARACGMLWPCVMPRANGNGLCNNFVLAQAI
jgi:hypothetical protein